jgi:hypothetical protein
VARGQADGRVFTPSAFHRLMALTFRQFNILESEGITRIDFIKMDVQCRQSRSSTLFPAKR